MKKEPNKKEKNIFNQHKKKSNLITPFNIEKLLFFDKLN